MRIRLLGLLKDSRAFTKFALTAKPSSKMKREDRAISGLFHHPVCVCVSFFGFYLSMKATLEDLASVMCIKEDESTPCVNIRNGRP